MRSDPKFSNPLRFLWKNRDTLLLAVLLSIAVWVSAVYANDPNSEGLIEPNVPLNVLSQDESLVLISQVPESVQVRLRAPESVWLALSENPDLIRATLDLSKVTAGENAVPVTVSLFTSPAQVLSVSPSHLVVQMDELVERRDFPVNLVESGEPAAGFQKDNATLLVEDVLVSGPASRMDLVTQVVAKLSLKDARQNFTSTVELFPANQDGEMISGLQISPKFADVEVEISQAGQYRDVAVVVETRGEPAVGYESTSIDVDPLIVTLYAENEEDIAEIPGFVSTKPIELTGKTSSFVIKVELELPEGVIQAGDTQTVAVSIGISPKVKNLVISVPISIRDLLPGLQAEPSPQTVEVFLTGPEPVMSLLETNDVIVFVSLENMEPGTYFVDLAWDVLLEQVDVLSINPDKIEVIISENPEANSPSP